MASLLEYGSDSSDSASERSAPTPKRPRQAASGSPQGGDDAMYPVPEGRFEAQEAPAPLTALQEIRHAPLLPHPPPAKPQERPLQPTMRIPEQMSEHLQRLENVGKLGPGVLTAEVVADDDFWRPSAGGAALAALGVDPDAAALEPLPGHPAPPRLPLRALLRESELKRSRLRTHMQQTWAKQAPRAAASAPLCGPGGPFVVAAPAPAPAPAARSDAPAVPPAVAVARAKAVAAARAAAAAVARRAVARAAATAQN